MLNVFQKVFWLLEGKNFKWLQFENMTDNTTTSLKHVFLGSLHLVN